MKYGDAWVSLGGKSASVDAQARQVTKAGCKKVFRDLHVSGVKPDRAQLRRVIEALEPGDVLMGDEARPAGTIHPRPVEYPRRHQRQEGRIPLAGRCMGRHHHITRAADADRTRWACGVRARPYPRAHRRRPGAGGAGVGRMQSAVLFTGTPGLIVRLLVSVIRQAGFRWRQKWRITSALPLLQRLLHKSAGRISAAPRHCEAQVRRRFFLCRQRSL